MKRATELFSKEEVAAIEATIAQVEARTSGEVVPVVVSASGRYERAQDAFGFLLALVALGVGWFLVPGLLPADWGGEILGARDLALLLLPVVLAYALGMFLAARFPALRLPLIPRWMMQDEVERRARETFQLLRLRETREATGVLIYVSLYERMVHVEGDAAVSARLGSGDWQGLCDTILDGFGEGNPAQGMQAGLLQCGELLARHFPAEPDDVNELVDRLHLLD